MNLAEARHNMIEQQIRPWDVLDQRVLELVANLPREGFVPSAYLSLAYADINILLEHGTGSGYVTALLAKSAKHVYSVDIFADFAERARLKLAGHGITNVTLETGDAATGWERDQPYDVLAVTGSRTLVPDSLRRQREVGGRLFVVTGDAPVMSAQLITRVSETGYSQQALFETVLPPLVNAPQPPRFVF